MENGVQLLGFQLHLQSVAPGYNKLDRLTGWFMQFAQDGQGKMEMETRTLRACSLFPAV